MLLGSLKLKEAEMCTSKCRTSTRFRIPSHTLHTHDPITNKSHTRTHARVYVHTHTHIHTHKHTRARTHARTLPFPHINTHLPNQKHDQHSFSHLHTHLPHHKHNHVHHARCLGSTPEVLCDLLLRVLGLIGVVGVKRVVGVILGVYRISWIWVKIKSIISVSRVTCSWNFPNMILRSERRGVSTRTMTNLGEKEGKKREKVR